MSRRRAAGPWFTHGWGSRRRTQGNSSRSCAGQAKEIAERDGRDLILVDGPPGIGCPVIASLTGATSVLAVTEPTLSGSSMTWSGSLPSRGISGSPRRCASNKWDLNASMAGRIEERAAAQGARIAGRVRYDPGVTAAQVRARAVVEIGGGAAEDIRQLWNTVSTFPGGMDARG